MPKIHKKEMVETNLVRGQSKKQHKFTKRNLTRKSVSIAKSAATFNWRALSFSLHK